MIYLSVFAVSFSTLLFEVLMNRAFAITQWSHLAFLIIGVALFGLSAGSVWVHRRMLKKPAPFTANITAKLSFATGIFIAASWILVHLIPFDSIQLPFSRIQIGYLAAVFIALALPFFFSGAVSATGFATAPEKPGAVYAASMTGSAAGALLPALLLPAAGFGGSIVIAAVIPLLPACISGDFKSRFAAALLTAAICSILFFPSILEPKPSSYKELQLYLQYPDAEITSRKETIGGRVETYSGSGFRSAPGLSLTYTGDIPSQTGVFVDSGAPVALYSGTKIDDFNFALESMVGAVYAAVENPRSVLIYLESGGSAIPAAIASNASKVSVIDRNSTRGSIVGNRYEKYGIDVLSGPPRLCLHAMEESFDVIVIDHLGSSIPGLISTNEDYVLTIESIGELYDKLSKEGFISISRRIQIPPSDSLKTFNTVYAALQKAGVGRPAAHICMIRNYNMYTLLLSRNPLSGSSVERILAFAERRGFDLVFLEGMVQSDANRFSRRDDAVYYKTIEQLRKSLETAGGFTSDYLFNICAATDDKPYFNRFIKWDRIDELYAVTGKRSHAFYFTGEILIGLVLLISLVLSIFIIMTPAVTLGVKRTRAQAFSATIFMLIGTGFMFFELAWIKRIIPLAGTQTAGFAAVVACLLVSSGLGGWFSERIDPKRLPLMAAVSCVFIMISTAGMRYLMPAVPGLPETVSWITILSLIALPGACMGTLIPLLMRGFCVSKGERLFGWAVNGTFSVLASTAATSIALFLGLQALGWMAAGLYMIGALASFRVFRTSL